MDSGGRTAEEDGDTFDAVVEGLAAGVEALDLEQLLPEETTQPGTFYSGDMVRCPQCKQLMKAPQSAYAWLLRSFHELLNCPC